MITQQITQSCADETSPISVRSPVSAKNAGRNRMVTTGVRSSAAARNRAVGGQNGAEHERAEDRVDADLLGDQRPRRSSPASVQSPLARRLLRRRRAASRTSDRPDDEEHDGDESHVSRADDRARRRRRPCHADDDASRHHAVTSLTAAQVSAATPSSVRVRPRSVRIRASTGNAVIDIATPMNSAKATNAHAGLAEAADKIAAPAPQPSTNGTRDARLRDRR